MTHLRLHRRDRHRSRLCTLLLALCALLASPHGQGHAEDEVPAAPARSLEERSLPLRTALHHDPTLGPPLDRLLEMYREAHRVDELVDLYRVHVRSWPGDQGARVVLIRLLQALHDPEAAAHARSAVNAHPENGILHWLHAQDLDARGDPRALDSLILAVKHAPDHGLRRRWVEQLLPRAVQEGRADVAAEQARLLAELAKGDAERLLSAAQALQRFGFPELALPLVDEALASSPAPDLQVEIEAFGAVLMGSVGRRTEAAQRLDSLLERLTPDHWRRPDLLRRRARLVEEDSSRDDLLARARQRVAQEPGLVAPVLDLARLLMGFDRPRDAQRVVLDALSRLPDAAELERLAIDLLEDQRDEAALEQFLDQRLKRQSDRQDLAERRARSLLLLGRMDEGLDLLERALGEQADAARLQRLVEMGRALRAQARVRAALGVYERAVHLAPARADLRRELAECQLQAGQRSAARRLLATPVPPETDPDAFLDLLGLLRRERFVAEALAQVEARLQLFPRELELHLALIELRAHVARFDGQAQRVLAARELADTGARYGRWLDIALEAMQLADAQAPFLAEEAQRLRTEGREFSPRQVDRIVAFAEGCAHADEVGESAGLLRELLSHRPPADAELRLRRALAQQLEGAARTLRGRQHLEAAARELALLAEQDAEWGDTHRARLALLRAREERIDLAAQLARGVDVGRIADPRLLSSLRDLYVALDDRSAALATLERQVQVEPTEQDHWQDWLVALASTGDEYRLRRAIRRLLAGVEHLPLALESTWGLKEHLSDSCWRSVAAALDRGTRSDLLEGLSLLDQCEVLMSHGEGEGWSYLARALLLDHLGDAEAREASLARLAAWLDLRRDDPHTRLTFPDGVEISAEMARTLLQTRPASRSEPAAAQPASAPARLTHLAWRFDVQAGDILAVRPLGPDAVLIVDSLGGLYAVDARTGELRWSQRTLLPAARLEGPLYSMQLPITCPAGEVLVPHVGGVTCLNADGSRRWIATVGRPGPNVPYVFHRDERVLAACASGGEAAAFDLATGRALWATPLPALLNEQEGRDGAALEGERLFVFGHVGVLIDARDGRILWSLDPARVRSLPPNLAEPGSWHRRRWAPRVTGLGAQAAFATGPHLPGGGHSAMFAQFTQFGAPQQPWLMAPLVPAAPAVSAGAGHSTVAHRARSLATWSPSASQATPAAAGAAWAAPLTPHETRGAWMDQGRLFLSRHLVSGEGAAGSVLQVDLDLPLRVTSVALRATRLPGFSGHALSHGFLLRMDDGQRIERHASLARIGPAQEPWVPTLVFDGSHLLVAGPTGILRLQRQTLERVDESAWPAGIDTSRWPIAAALTHLPEGISGRDSHGRPLHSQVSLGLARQQTAFIIVAPNSVVALQDEPVAREQAPDGSR